MNHSAIKTNRLFLQLVLNLEKGGTSTIRKNKLKPLAIAAAITVAGCSQVAIQPQERCELMTAQICSRAAESQLLYGTLTVNYPFQPEDARVVPFVVPVFRQDGLLAAEVDCYANADPHTYSVVRSELVISPTSQESVDFLRTRHLCSDKGSDSGDEQPRLPT